MRSRGDVVVGVTHSRRCGHGDSRMTAKGASHATATRVSRRAFLQWVAGSCTLVPSIRSAPEPTGTITDEKQPAAVTLFLCGDVMTGRGIDQVLPHPGSPRLFEPYLNSALSYVDLAERLNGPIARRVAFAYIWGDGLNALARAAPWPGKGIHYRMHPANLPCLTAAGIDCCVLGNNHVLDWSYAGLDETRRTLRDAGIRHAGAGADLTQAQAPPCSIWERRAASWSSARVRRAAASRRSGRRHRPGRGSTCCPTCRSRRSCGLRRASPLCDAPRIWWWCRCTGVRTGAIPDEHRRFAHGLIEHAAVDVVHGHSSHHLRALEVFRDRLILYGYGDLINDYEGIKGYAEYRADLGLM